MFAIEKGISYKQPKRKKVLDLVQKDQGCFSHRHFPLVNEMKIFYIDGLVIYKEKNFSLSLSPLQSSKPCARLELSHCHNNTFFIFGKSENFFKYIKYPNNQIPKLLTHDCER